MHKPSDAVRFHQGGGHRSATKLTMKLGGVRYVDVSLWQANPADKESA